jgi:hypothetical protein
MIDEISLRAEDWDIRTFGYRTLNDREAAIVADLRKVLQGTGGTIIDHRHAVTFPKKTFDQVRADKSRAAGHQNISP